MKLCGQISIELPAEDHFAIADHKKRLEDILSYIRESYPEATLTLRERRERKAFRLAHAAPRAATGALNNPGLQYLTDRAFSSRSYLDLTANFTVHNNLNFRVGVNNVFDKDPPVVGASNCPAGPCNGGTYPQVYDALGRYVFVGLSADF